MGLGCQSARNSKLSTFMGHQGHFTRHCMIDQELISSSLNRWGRWPCTRRGLQERSNRRRPQQQTVPRMNKWRRGRRPQRRGSSLRRRLSRVNARHTMIHSQLLLC